MKKKVHLSADHANSDQDMGFWWLDGVDSIAAVSIDPTGVRFDGGDFTVEIANPGRANESVEVLVNGIVVFRSARRSKKTSGRLRWMGWSD